jgi:DNA-binding MarR family transcriptional regulator
MKVPQDRLGQMLEIDKANVSRGIRKLESSGYINRVSGEKDGRVRLVTLTDKGEKVRKPVLFCSKTWAGGLKKISESEWDQLVRFLEKNRSCRT